MKLPRFMTRKRKLRATATRRVAVADAGFDDMAEPNMKLSRALLIVLLLHVVAVAGIIAFNAIKSRQGNTPQVMPATAALRPSPASVPSVEETKPLARSEKKSKSADSGLHLDSAKSYVVAKGDNPLTIAKKLKVPYHELLALNHIDDPRKLKIGQKLIVPQKKTKKSEE